MLARVFGGFLSWLLDQTAPVFVLATANSIHQLPREMLRKGRWDDLFVVDLPNESERQAICAIVIARYQRNPNECDLLQLAKATEGLTGAEIEQAFIESLCAAFDEGRESTDLTIATGLHDLVPLSTLMGEQITSLRAWAKGTARTATSSVGERKGRKLG